MAGRVNMDAKGNPYQQCTENMDVIQSKSSMFWKQGC